MGCGRTKARSARMLGSVQLRPLTSFELPSSEACRRMMAGYNDLAGSFLAAVESKTARALAAAPCFSSLSERISGERAALKTLSTWAPMKVGIDMKSPSMTWNEAVTTLAAAEKGSAEWKGRGSAPGSAKVRQEQTRPEPRP